LVLKAKLYSLSLWLNPDLGGYQLYFSHFNLHKVHTISNAQLPHFWSLIKDEGLPLELPVAALAHCLPLAHDTHHGLAGLVCQRVQGRQLSLGFDEAGIAGLDNLLNFFGRIVVGLKESKHLQQQSAALEGQLAPNEELHGVFEGQLLVDVGHSFKDWVKSLLGQQELQREQCLVEKGFHEVAALEVIVTLLYHVQHVVYFALGVPGGVRRRDVGALWVVLEVLVDWSMGPVNHWHSVRFAVFLVEHADLHFEVALGGDVAQVLFLQGVAEKALTQAMSPVHSVFEAFTHFLSLLAHLLEVWRNLNVVNLGAIAIRMVRHVTSCFFDGVLFRRISII